MTSRNDAMTRPDALEWAQQWAVAPWRYYMPPFLAMPIFAPLGIAELGRDEVHARAKCARACVRAILAGRRQGSTMPGVTQWHVAKVVRIAREWSRRARRV